MLAPCSLLPSSIRLFFLTDHLLLCAADDGISIPCEYTSYLAPMCSAKLHYEVAQGRDINKGPRVSIFVVFRNGFELHSMVFLTSFFYVISSIAHRK